METQSQIPWHIVNGEAQPEIGIAEGWRLLLVEEFAEDGDEAWVTSRGQWLASDVRYKAKFCPNYLRTKRPLPEPWFTRDYLAGFPSRNTATEANALETGSFDASHDAEPDCNNIHYREMIEAAHRSGLRIQAKLASLPNDSWDYIPSPQFDWEHCIYRIHPDDRTKPISVREHIEQLNAEIAASSKRLEAFKAASAALAELEPADAALVCEALELIWMR